MSRATQGEQCPLPHPALLNEMNLIACALYTLPPDVRLAIIQRRYRTHSTALTPYIMGRMKSKDRKESQLTTDTDTNLINSTLGRTYRRAYDPAVGDFQRFRTEGDEHYIALSFEEQV